VGHGTTVKVTTVGNSIGIVLPKDVLERLHIEKGDLLYISETPGGVQLTPFKPEFARVVEAGRRATRKYRNALRKLAE
jgi:putative addiction module antidote